MNAVGNYWICFLFLFFSMPEQGMFGNSQLNRTRNTDGAKVLPSPVWTCSRKGCSAVTSRILIEWIVKSRLAWLMVAVALKGFTDELLSEGLQVTSSNPLSGLSGRAALLKRLGSTLEESAAVFGKNGLFRPGYMFGISHQHFISFRLSSFSREHFYIRWKTSCSYSNVMGCSHYKPSWDLARRTHQIHRRRKRTRRRVESIHLTFPWRWYISSDIINFRP